MAERGLLETEPGEFTTDSKWIAGISSGQPVCEVASRVLDAHATALTLFGQWLSKSEAVAERAFLEGLVLAEQQATADLRAAFLATWTTKGFDRLKRQSGAYC